MLGVRIQRPRLAMMGVDRGPAGFEGGADEAGRLLGVARRLAPGAEALILTNDQRVSLVMVLPPVLDADTLWDEVIFATVPDIGPTLSIRDHYRLGLRVETDTAAARRLFRTIAGMEAGRHDVSANIQEARDGRAQAVAHGTLGSVLSKSLAMGIALAEHVEQTMDSATLDGLDDHAGLEEFIESTVLAWGRWHGILRSDDDRTDVLRWADDETIVQLAKATGRSARDLRGLTGLALRQLQHDETARARAASPA